jgi:hypothetical protein
MAGDGTTNWKFVLGSVAVILVVAGLAIFSYGVVTSSIKESSRNELQSVAGVMATQINASEIYPLKPGDEISPQYIALLNNLRVMRSMDDRITNAYILHVSDDQTITFIADDLFIQDPQRSARIGDVYISPDKKEIFGALSLPMASQSPYTDKWGTFISGYAPIDDPVNGSGGNTSAVLGVDMSASVYTARVQAAGVNLLLATIVSMLILVGVMYVVTRRTEVTATESKGTWEED